MYKLNKNKKIIIGIIVAIVVILIIYMYIKENEKELIPYEEEISENILKNETNETEKNNIKKENKEIIVHISGYVNTEGIIFLHEGDRITNAIEKAGGLKDGADISKINLARVLDDGTKIYIPGINDENIIKNESIENNNDETEAYIENFQNQTKEGKKEINKKININTANQTELETLPGIGTSTALKIINYRKEKGKFTTIDEIKEVSGIGEAKFNGMKDQIQI